MTEQEIYQDEAKAPEQTPGQILSAARLAQGIQLNELADLIKVPVNVLEAIEKDRIPKNLPETFVRGYIRSYARKLGVDENLVLTQIETTAAFEKPQSDHQEMQSFSRRNKRKALERRLTIATWIIVIVLILAAGIWWWQDSKTQDLAPVAGSDKAEPQLTVPNDELVNPTNNVNNDGFGDQNASQQSEPLGADAEESGSEATSGEAAGSAETLTPVETATPAHLSEQTTFVSAPTLEENQIAESSPGSTQGEAGQDLGLTPEQQPMQLTQEQIALVADNGEVDEEGFMRVEMHFENECWVEVYDVNEERIAVGNKPAGYLMTLNAQGPFNVLLGNPVGVSIWVNGKEFDTTALPRNRVARFELDVVESSTEVVQ